MNDNIIELKFKEKDQHVKWEDISIIRTICANDLKSTIEWIKSIALQCVEIRWNYQGSSQGRYVDGNISRYGQMLIVKEIKE